MKDHLQINKSLLYQWQDEQRNLYFCFVDIYCLGVKNTPLKLQGYSFRRVIAHNADVANDDSFFIGVPNPFLSMV
jgi:hypothetical protein